MHLNQKLTFSYQQKIEKKYALSSPAKKSTQKQAVQAPKPRQVKSEPAPSNKIPMPTPIVSVSDKEGVIEILGKSSKSASVSLPENNHSAILSGMVPFMQKIPSFSMEESWKRKDKVIIKVNEVLKRIQEVEALDFKVKNVPGVPKLKEY